MRLFRYAALLICALAIAAPPLRAQEEESASREVVREKLRMTPEQIEQLTRSLPERQEVSGELSAGSVSALPPEMIVSSTAQVESELHAAVNPTSPSNMIVSVIQQGNANVNPTTWLICPIYYTRDLGKTWKRSSFNTLPPATFQLMLGGGDPMLCFDADGTAYISWINLYQTAGVPGYTFGLYWAYSTNGGESWTRPPNPVIGAGKVSSDGGEVFDKQWMVADTTSSPYRNNLYCTFMHARGSEPPAIGVRTRRAGTTSFTTSDVVIAQATEAQFASIDVGPNGDVHVTYYSKGASGPALYHAVSTDGGATFSEPNMISTFHLPRISADAAGETIVGISRDRIYPCPHLAIDHSNGPTRGNLYQVWTADGITGREDYGLDIYLSRSTDNGRSWSMPIVVNDDSRQIQTQQFYPSMTINSQGIVTVSWYDRRDDPSLDETHYYLAHSTDGGLTFSANFKVTSEATDFSTVGIRNGSFGIGEYTQMVSSGKWTIPFWADGRKGTGDLDVYGVLVEAGTSTTAEVIEVADAAGELELGEPAFSGGRIALSLKLRTPADVSVGLYDMAGKALRSVVPGRLEAGPHSLAIPADELHSGGYLVRVTTGAAQATRRVIVIR